MSAHRASDEFTPADEERRLLIEQVLCTHLQQRLQGGDVVDEAVLAKHPELMPELADQLQMLREVADQRVLNEALEAGDVGTGNLTVRCPNCHKKVRVSADASVSEITCGGCGSCFSLAADLTMTEPSAGAQRLGHFDLLEQIGTGSFGSVWKARDNELDRCVAVKIPRRSRLNSNEVNQFLREARAVAQLSHPNIVSVHEVGREGETVFIVSDLVRGTSLSDCHRGQRFSIPETCTLCATIADALHHAHEAGVIHRDLKPQNIMLDEEGEPHLLDFGLAQRRASEITMTIDGNVLGTPAYMPPEQARGEAHQAGREADIYSLGVILFELLTGELPFRGNARMLMHQVLHDEAPSPRKLNSNVSRDLETICLKCLEKEPNRRFESAQLLAQELRRCVDGTPTLTRPISPLSHAWRWAGRNKGMTTALASIVTLLVAGTVASTVFAIYFHQREDLAEYAQYVSNIQAVNPQSGDKRSTILARRALKSAPPKHRNWEWGHLSNLVWRPAPLQNRIADVVDSAQFWRDGESEIYRELVPTDETGAISEGQFMIDNRNAIVVQKNGSLVMIDLTDNSEVRVYHEPNTPLNTVATSPDGKKFITSAIAGGAFVFDFLATRAQVMQPLGSSKNTAWDWEWSPDQKYVLSSQFGREVRVLNATTLEQVGTLLGHDAEVRDFHFSNSGDVVWTASFDGTIRKWSLPDGEPLSPVYTAPFAKNMVYHAFSPDRRSAVAVFKDGSSSIWEIETGSQRDLGKPLGDVNAEMRRKAAVFSPDGSCVAVMSGLFAAKIYDVENCLEIGEIKGQASPLRSIAFSPDATKLMTISSDGVAIVWSSRIDAAQNTRTFSNAHDDAIFQIDLSGDRLLSGSFDSAVSVWNTTTREWIGAYDGHTGNTKEEDEEDIRIVAVDINNADPTRAASLDSNGSFHVWELETQRPLFHIDPESGLFAGYMARTGGGRRGLILNFPAVLSTGLFTPDGRRVVTFQNDSMKVFDSRNGNFEVALEGANDHGWPVYSHDSKLVAVLEMNQENARVWDMKTGKLKYEIGDHKYALGMIAFSPHTDRLVTGGMDGVARIWNSRTGDRLHDLEDQSGFVVSCRFSPDGRFVFTGHFDNLARIWDADTGKLLTTLHGHTAAICDVRMSPDGTRFLTWATDSKAIVWDDTRPLANPLVTLSGDSRLLQAHWSPDGRDIVTSWLDGNTGGSIGVWSGATKEDLSSFFGQPMDTSARFETGLKDWREKVRISIAPE